MPDQNRISLGLATINDAPMLLPLFSNADVVRLTNFRRFTVLEDLKTFLVQFLSIHKGQPLQYGPYCIFLNDSVIGICGLQQKDLGLGIAEAWYLIDENFWGKGYGAQTVYRLIKNTQDNPALKIIVAEAVNSNEASWRILEKNGFVRTSFVKDGFKKQSITADLFTYTLEFHA